MRRPDPTRHQRADLYQGWDDPAPHRRDRIHRARDRGERVWWGIVGLAQAFALLMIARSFGAAGLL